MPHIQTCCWASKGFQRQTTIQARGEMSQPSADGPQAYIEERDMKKSELLNWLQDEYQQWEAFEFALKQTR